MLYHSIFRQSLVSFKGNKKCCEDFKINIVYKVESHHLYINRNMPSYCYLNKYQLFEHLVRFVLYYRRNQKKEGKNLSVNLCGILVCKVNYM